MPTCRSAGCGGRPKSQRRCALRALEAVEPAMVAQHREQHVLGHRAGQRRVDHARDRHLGQGRVRDQPLDAGAEREDRLEVGIARELARRRPPHQRESRSPPGRRPRARSAPRARACARGELVPPQLGRIVRAEKHQGHPASSGDWPAADRAALPASADPQADDDADREEQPVLGRAGPQVVQQAAEEAARLLAEIAAGSASLVGVHARLLAWLPGCAGPPL